MAVFGSPWLSVSAQQAPQCATESGSMVLTAVPSAIYGKPVAVNVYLPPCYAADRPTLYPVIYLLHGGNADETQWPDLNVQSAADTLISHGAPPFVVVMPGATYYESIDYGAFVVKELLPTVESQYHVKAVRSGRAIGGLSLGGYWALKIAFTHPDLFAAVGGYSPIVSRGLPGDPLPLAYRIDVKTLQGLNIALDVGDQDSLVYSTNTFAHILRMRGVSVSLTSGHGGHNRPYWRAHIHDYFSFFLKTFAQAQESQPVL
jgi:enterochelin esterase-like enzyme